MTIFEKNIKKCLYSFNNILINTLDPRDREKNAQDENKIRREKAVQGNGVRECKVCAGRKKALYDKKV